MTASFGIWRGFLLWLAALLMPTVRAREPVNYECVLLSVPAAAQLALVGAPAIAMLAAALQKRVIALGLASLTLIGALFYAGLRFYIIWFSNEDGSFGGPRHTSLRSILVEAAWVFMLIGALAMWKSARAAGRTVGESHG